MDNDELAIQAAEDLEGHCFGCPLNNYNPDTKHKPHCGYFASCQLAKARRDDEQKRPA